MTSDQRVSGVAVWSHAASRRSTWVMVQIVADGVRGVGELSDGGAVDPLVAAARAVHGAIVGLTVGQARTAVRRLVGDRRAAATDRRDLFLWSTVLGGYESAFADLAARLAGRPLSAALGLGAPGPVRAYANVNRRFGADGPEVVVAEAVRAARDGYPAVKIAPFTGMQRPGATGARVRAGLSLVSRVRAAIPAATLLMVDCHHLVPLALVDRVARDLAQLDVHWVEDLVDVRDPAALHLAASAGIPLAGGEHIGEPSAARIACATGALSYWLVDPKHAGGPDGVARIAEAVEGAVLTFHNPSGPVGTAHAAQLAALGGGGDMTWLEVAWGEPDRADFLDPGEAVVAGRFRPATGPGIGCVPRRRPDDAPAVDDGPDPSLAGSTREGT